MSKGFSASEPNAREIYADIIDMPHHQSYKHPHMSLYDRAAQFSPFAALTGYDDMVTEEAQRVNITVGMGENEKIFDVNGDLIEAPHEDFDPEDYGTKEFE